MVENFYWYLALKFATGFFKAGYILAGFVLLTELIGPTKRGFMGILTQAFFAVGILIYSLIAYYIRYWRTLTLTTSCIGIPLLLLGCMVLPESPRWLLSKGKLQSTISVLKDIAMGNNAKWDQKLLSLSSSDEDSEDEDKITIQPHLTSTTVLGDSVKDLFVDKFLLSLTLIQIYSWFCNSASYYGLTLAAGTSGDLYMGTALSGCVEIPAYLLCFLTLTYFGRTTNIAAFMVSGGVAMLFIPFIGPYYPFFVTSLGLFGKLCISSSFAIM